MKRLLYISLIGLYFLASLKSIGFCPLNLLMGQDESAQKTTVNVTSNLSINKTQINYCGSSAIRDQLANEQLKTGTQIRIAETLIHVQSASGIGLSNLTIEKYRRPLPRQSKDFQTLFSIFRI